MLEGVQPRRAICTSKSGAAVYHHIGFLGLLLLVTILFGLLLLRPKRQVVLAFVLLYIEVQGLRELLVVHPY